MSTKSGTETFDDLVTTTLPALVGEASAQGGRLYRSVMARVEQPLLRHALELCGGRTPPDARCLILRGTRIGRRRWSIPRRSCFRI